MHSEKRHLFSLYLRGQLWEAAHSCSFLTELVVMKTGVELSLQCSPNISVLLPEKVGSCGVGHSDMSHLSVLELEGLKLGWVVYVLFQVFILCNFQKIYLCGPNLPCFLFWYIKLCWNMAVPIHLHIVYCCFHAITTELSSYDRGHMAHKAENIYYLTHWRKKNC